MPGPDVFSPLSSVRVLSTLLSAWDVAGSWQTWDILWVIAAELQGWCVLEPFRAEGPELGKVWLANGCKVLCVLSGHCFATAEQGRSASLSLLLGGGQCTGILQGPHPRGPWVLPMAQVELNPPGMAAKH